MKLTTPYRLIFSLTLLLGIGQPALALPGQTPQTLMRWSEQHTFLNKLKQGTSELSGLPYYTTEAKKPNSGVRFTASPVSATNPRIEEETIVFRTTQSPSTFAFTRNNRQGLDLIQKVYGAAITRDFGTAKYVARVEYPDLTLQFYRGGSFGYITTQFKPMAGQQERFYHFSVIALNQLGDRVTTEQRCQKQNPQGGCRD